MTRPALLVLAAALQCVAACSAPTPPSATALMQPITSAIGDAACDQPDQCRVIPVGNKPCGGPRAYLAWSTRSTDENALQAAVLAQSAAEQRENAASGMRSNCSVTPVPSASCQPRASDGKKTCQLNAASLRGLD